MHVFSPLLRGGQFCPTKFQFILHYWELCSPFRRTQIAMQILSFVLLSVLQSLQELCDLSTIKNIWLVIGLIVAVCASILGQYRNTENYILFKISTSFLKLRKFQDRYRLRVVSFLLENPWGRNLWKIHATQVTWSSETTLLAAHGFVSHARTLTIYRSVYEIWL